MKIKAREWLMVLRGDLTQQQVADMAGISRSYYTGIETGLRNASVSAAKAIGKVLGFKWTKFFDDDCCETHQSTGTEGR